VEVCEDDIDHSRFSEVREAASRTLSMKKKSASPLNSRRFFSYGNKRSEPTIQSFGFMIFKYTNLLQNATNDSFPVAFFST